MGLKRGMGWLFKTSLGPLGIMYDGASAFLSDDDEDEEDRRANQAFQRAKSEWTGPHNLFWMQERERRKSNLIQSYNWRIANAHDRQCLLNMIDDYIICMETGNPESLFTRSMTWTAAIDNDVIRDRIINTTLGK